MAHRALIAALAGSLCVLAGSSRGGAPAASSVRVRDPDAAGPPARAAGPQCTLRPGGTSGATFAIITAPAQGGNNVSECCDACFSQYGNASGFNGTGCRSWVYSVQNGCWLKAEPSPTHQPRDRQTSGVVVAPTVVTGPDADTDYVCCAFNATALVPGFATRFPGDVKGRSDTAPAGNMTACVDICASLHYYGCRAASWNSPTRQCYLKTAKGHPVHRPGDHSFVLGFK
eukprot:SAG22_NODE_1595_length_4037_cov_45.725495_3_plen_229_part_00